MRRLALTIVSCLALVFPATASAAPSPWHFDRWIGDHRESLINPVNPVPTSDGSWWMFDRLEFGGFSSLRHLSADGTALHNIHEIDGEHVTNTLQLAAFTVLDDDNLMTFGTDGRVVDPDTTRSSSTFGGVGAGVGEWQSPADAATAPDGSVFLLDDATNNVIHFTATGTLIAEWGTPGDNSNPGELSGAEMIAVAPNGSVWIGSNNQLLQHFTSAGVFLGDFAIPQGAGAGEVADISDFQVASNGDLVVLDSQNSRVQRFASNGTFNTQIGGADAAEGGIEAATALGLDRSSGQIVVLTSLNGNAAGMILYANDGTFESSCCARVPSATGYRFPVMVAAGDDSSFFVTEIGVQRVTQRDEGGNILRTFGGVGNGPGQFAQTDFLNVAAADDGSVWVLAEENPTQIWHYADDGSVIGGISQTGNGTGQFDEPSAMAAANDGSVWIYDSNNQRVQHLAADGSFLASFGTPGNAAGEMSGETYGIEVLDDGRIVLAQFVLGRVVCYQPDGTVDWSIDSVPGLTSPLSPIDLTTTDDGTLVVSMLFHSMLVELDPADGTFVQLIDPSDGTPTATPVIGGVTTDSRGRLIVADYYNSRVFRLSQDTEEPPVAHDVTLSIRSGVNGRNIVARRGSIDVDVAGAVGGVTWSARWKGRRVPITASGKIRVRHLSQGRGRLVVTATDSEGATGTLRRRLIVDRTAPHVRTATTTLSTMSPNGVIRFSDHLTGATTRRINVTRLHLGINVIRVKVRDRAGNTRVVRVRITRHLSLTNHNANRGITLRNLFGHRVDASRIDINDIFSYQQPTLPWYHQTTLARPYVLELQHRLQDLHHLSRHHTTGHLDLETIRAIKRFQRAHHLPVIATAGPRTRRALEHAWQRRT